MIVTLELLKIKIRVKSSSCVVSLKTLFKYVNNFISVIGGAGFNIKECLRCLVEWNSMMRAIDYDNVAIKLYLNIILD